MVQAWQPAVICFGSLVGGLKGSSGHRGCGSVSTNMTANGGLFKWDCWFEAGNPGAWLCAVPVRVVCRVGTIGVFVRCPLPVLSCARSYSCKWTSVLLFAFLAWGGCFDCSGSCCPGFGPQVSFKPHRSRVALGLEFAPGEECVLCVVGQRHFYSDGGEVRPPHERRVGLGRMAVF